MRIRRRPDADAPGRPFTSRTLLAASYTFLGPICTLLGASRTLLTDTPVQATGEVSNTGLKEIGGTVPGGHATLGAGGTAGRLGDQLVPNALRRVVTAWVIAASAACVPRKALSMTKSWMMPW